MTREEFIARHERHWGEFEEMLRILEDPRRSRPGFLRIEEQDADLTRFDSLYRMVSAHLALVRQRQYGTDLETRLNDLALRAYTHLYSRKRSLWRQVQDLLMRDFPRAVREISAQALIAGLVFAVPLAGLLVSIVIDPPVVSTILSPEHQQALETMYDPDSEHFARERASDGNLAMFGFYIYNNIGIAFRTYAGGLVAGVGSLFVLLYNGAAIGASMGFVTSLGYGGTFFPFVAGHSAFELTAIVLSGAAGLDLGWSLLAPGRLSRIDALRRAGRRSALVVGGVFTLLLVAAFVEAYWSPLLAVPSWIKYSAGILNWLVVIAWLMQGWRARGS